MISKFGSPRKSFYPDIEEYYAIFKKFYLTNNGITFEDCRKNAAKISNTLRKISKCNDI